MQPEIGLLLGLSVVVVFLLLAALYNSWSIPLAVLLVVPFGVLGALVATMMGFMPADIYFNVGLITIIGLAAKNAILIVEFAKQAEDDEGMNRFDAAVSAARTRLRPILMTSFSFILGVVPLMLASGPGAEMRQSLGTAVFSGMLGVTFFGLIFTPVFYVIMRWVSGKLPRTPGKDRTLPTTYGTNPHDPYDPDAPAPAHGRGGDL